MTVFLALALGAAKKLWDACAFYIVTAGVFVSALFYMLLKGRAQGRAKLKGQLREADKKSTIKTAKIIKSIEKATEAENDKRMDKWYRD